MWQNISFETCAMVANAFIVECDACVGRVHHTVTADLVFSHDGILVMWFFDMVLDKICGQSRLNTLTYFLYSRCASRAISQRLRLGSC